MGFFKKVKKTVKNPVKEITQVPAPPPPPPPPKPVKPKNVKKKVQEIKKDVEDIPEVTNDVIIEPVIKGVENNIIEPIKEDIIKPISNLDIDTGNSKKDKILDTGENTTLLPVLLITGVVVGGYFLM